MLVGGDEYQKIRKEIKSEWEQLWNTRYDDKTSAEKISIKDFKKLFVDKGEVFVASRCYKPLNFTEILEKNLQGAVIERIQPDPTIGGWKKFSKEFFPAKKKKRRRPYIKVDAKQPQRKGGAGWINSNRLNRNVR